MSDVSTPDSGSVGRGTSNRKGSGDKWGHLPADKREQYEAIEARVRDKVARGEL